MQCDTYLQKQRRIKIQWKETVYAEKFHDIKLLCLLTLNSSETRAQVGIKSEGECENSKPEQVRTNVRLGGNTGGLTLKRKKMLSPSFFDGGVGKKEFLLHLKWNTAHLDEKQLIVPEIGVDYFGS